MKKVAVLLLAMCAVCLCGCIGLGGVSRNYLFDGAVYDRVSGERMDSVNVYSMTRNPFTETPDVKPEGKTSKDGYFLAGREFREAGLNCCLIPIFSIPFILNVPERMYFYFDKEGFVPAMLMHESKDARQRDPNKYINPVGDIYMVHAVKDKEFIGMMNTDALNDTDLYLVKSFLYDKQSVMLYLKENPAGKSGKDDNGRDADGREAGEYMKSKNYRVKAIDVEVDTGVKKTELRTVSSVTGKDKKTLDAISMVEDMKYLKERGFLLSNVDYAYNPSEEVKSNSKNTILSALKSIYSELKPLMKEHGQAMEFSFGATLKASDEDWDAGDMGLFYEYNMNKDGTASVQSGFPVSIKISIQRETFQNYSIGEISIPLKYQGLRAVVSINTPLKEEKELNKKISDVIYRYINLIVDFEDRVESMFKTGEIFMEEETPFDVRKML